MSPAQTALKGRAEPFDQLVCPTAFGFPSLAVAFLLGIALGGFAVFVALRHFKLLVLGSLAAASPTVRSLGAPQVSNGGVRRIVTPSS